ncbi:MAG: hypothetical protein K2Q10_01655 [Rhodospirillales bacterium]|nr:hypothetical protein [Rhodospirillales bacterium]
MALVRLLLFVILVSGAAGMFYAVKRRSIPAGAGLSLAIFLLALALFIAIWLNDIIG